MSRETLASPVRERKKDAVDSKPCKFGQTGGMLRRAIGSAVSIKGRHFELIATSRRSP